MTLVRYINTPHHAWIPVVDDYGNLVDCFDSFTFTHGQVFRDAAANYSRTVQDTSQEFWSTRTWAKQYAAGSR